MMTVVVSASMIRWTYDGMAWLQVIERKNTQPRANRRRACRVARGMQVAADGADFLLLPAPRHFADRGDPRVDESTS